MVPTQPCIDEFGRDTCNLQRFHLNDITASRRIPPTTPPVDPPSSRRAVTFLPGIIGSSTVPRFPQRPGAAALSRDRLNDLVEKAIQKNDVVDVNPRALPARIKASIQTSPMNDEEYTAAAMSRAAYIQYSEGEAATRRYTAKSVGDGWTYDAELSNEMGVVFSRGDDSAIAYRGTQEAPGLNADWEANLRNRIGADQLLSPTQQETVIAEQLKMVRVKHPGRLALTTGHSRGGAEAYKTALRVPVDRVITFNSASYGPENLVPLKTKVTSLRTVGKLSGDLVSASGDALSVGRVKYVSSTYGENPATGLHDLRNFEETPYEAPTPHPPEPGGIELTETGVKAPRPNVVTSDDVLAPVPKSAPPPDRIDEFGALTDIFEESMQATKPIKIPTSVTGALSQTGVGFGVGYGVSKLYQEIGVTNPYANATMTGATTGGLLAGGGELLASAALSTSMSRLAVRTALSSAARGMAEGVVFAPIGMGVDQLTNIGYRAAGASKSAAGALSGASSALVLGGISAGVATTSTSIAAGELAFGPEMIPLAAATFLGGAIASWLGFEAGSAEEKQDAARERSRQHAKAENYLAAMLATGDYDSYGDAKAAMKARRPAWAENIGDGFENTAAETLDGSHHGVRPTYATVDQLQKQRKAALATWNHSTHYSGHGLRYGSLFWNSAPARVTSKYDQQIVEANYRAVANKYLAAYITAQANGRLSSFQTPLTSDEQDTLTAMDANWLAHLQTTANLVHAHQVLTARSLQHVQDSMIASIAAGETIDLSDDDMTLLKQNPEQSAAIMNSVHDAENQQRMRDTVTKTADDLNVSFADLASYYDRVNAGMTAERAWKLQAHTQGFLSVDDYERFRTKDPEAHMDDIMTAQQDFARKALDLHSKATDAGFDSVDEYLLQNDPAFAFQANASEIAMAHELGLTIPEYVQFLQGVVETPSSGVDFAHTWNADMYKLAKKYTDIAGVGDASSIDPETEAIRYAREVHTQHALMQQYEPTATYVDPVQGDIIAPSLASSSQKENITVS